MGFSPTTAAFVDVDETSTPTAALRGGAGGGRSLSATGGGTGVVKGFRLQNSYLSSN